MSKRCPQCEVRFVEPVCRCELCGKWLDRANYAVLARWAARPAQGSLPGATGPLSERPAMMELGKAVDSPGPSCIPIVLGIVGHRDLRHCNEPVLQAAVKKVFQEFEDAFPESPKVVLTSLAAGADQLVAREALNMGKGWSVRAPLPYDSATMAASASFKFKPGDYKDYPDGVHTGAIKEFHDLLKDPRVEHFTVPLPESVALDKGTITWDAEDRNWKWEDGTSVDWGVVSNASDPKSREYELNLTCLSNAGGFIMQHCHTLLALWDLNRPEFYAGAAESVRFQLGGVSPRYYPWKIHEPLGFDGERGPVIALRTPREDKDRGATGERTVFIPPQERSNDPSQWNPGYEIKLDKVAWKPRRWWPQILALLGFESRLKDADPNRGYYPEYEQFLQICQAIEDFNRDASEIELNQKLYSKPFEDAMREARENPAPFSEEPRFHVRSWAQRIAEATVVTEYLTGGGLDWHRRWDMRVLFFGLFLTVVCFHLYSHPPELFFGKLEPHHHPLLPLGVFLAIWLTMPLVVAVAWWKRWDTRRMDYRALAEALRVRNAWAVGGVGRSVVDSYLAQMRSELAWVRRAMQFLCPPPSYWRVDFDRHSTGNRQLRVTLVLKDWIEKQKEYFHDKSHRHHNNFRRLKWVALAFAAFGWVWLFGLMLLKLFGYEGHILPHAGHLGAWPVIGSSFCFVVGGILIAIAEKRSYEQLSKQFDQLYRVFLAAEREVKDILNPTILDEIRILPPGSIKRQVSYPSHLIDFDRLRNVLERLGREAAHEHAQWLLLQRSKPFELPLG